MPATRQAPTPQGGPCAISRQAAAAPAVSFTNPHECIARTEHRRVSFCAVRSVLCQGRLKMHAFAPVENAPPAVFEQPAGTNPNPAQRANGDRDREPAVDIAVRRDLLKLVVGEAEERDQRCLVDLLGEALPLRALAGGQNLKPASEIDLQVRYGLLAIGLGRQAVAPGGLQASVAGELGDEDEVVARAHEFDHERVPQDVRRQLEPRARQPGAPRARSIAMTARSQSAARRNASRAPGRSCCAP